MKNIQDLQLNQVANKMFEATECETCNGDGYIEIMGDGANFEWDCIGTKPCPDCQSNDN